MKHLLYVIYVLLTPFRWVANWARKKKIRFNLWYTRHKVAFEYALKEYHLRSTSLPKLTVEYLETLPPREPTWEEQYIQQWHKELQVKIETEKKKMEAAGVDYHDVWNMTKPKVEVKSDEVTTIVRKEQV